MIMCIKMGVCHHDLYDTALTDIMALALAIPREDVRVIVIGDVHGQWTALLQRLRRYDITDQDLIQVGDFGVGFGPSGQEQGDLRILDAALAGTGNTLWVIRGNHDDPAYFNDPRPSPYRHIRFLPDYSIEIVGGRKILFVGGATSVDRIERTAGKDYWPGEAFLLVEHQVASLDLEGLWAIVTHTAPDFTAPTRLDTIARSFVTRDPTLSHDLAAERKAVTGLYDLVTRHVRPQYWFYGHFHTSVHEEIAGTRFVMLAIMELYGLM